MDSELLPHWTYEMKVSRTLINVSLNVLSINRVISQTLMKIPSYPMMPPNTGSNNSHLFPAYTKKENVTFKECEVWRNQLQVVTKLKTILKRSVTYHTLSVILKLLRKDKGCNINKMAAGLIGFFFALELRCSLFYVDIYLIWYIDSCWFLIQNSIIYKKVYSVKYCPSYLFLVRLKLIIQ